MKKPRFIVILHGICAVLFTVNAILEIFFKTHDDSVFRFVLNILCAVLWNVLFFVNLKRYCSNKDE